MLLSTQLDAKACAHRRPAAAPPGRRAVMQASLTLQSHQVQAVARTILLRDRARRRADRSAGLPPPADRRAAPAPGNRRRSGARRRECPSPPLSCDCCEAQGRAASRCAPARRTAGSWRGRRRRRHRCPRSRRAPGRRARRRRRCRAAAVKSASSIRRRQSASRSQRQLAGRPAPAGRDGGRPARPAPGRAASACSRPCCIRYGSITSSIVSRSSASAAASVSTPTGPPP